MVVHTAIPARKQKDIEVTASLGYIVRPFSVFESSKPE